MNRTFLFIALATAFAQLPLNADEPRPKAAGGAAAQNETFADGSARVYIEELEPTVHLSDGQKKEIADIIRLRIESTTKRTLRDGDKRRDAMIALDDARKHKDKGAIDRAKRALDDLLAPERDAWRESEDKLDAVLTPEQREKVMVARATEWAHRLVEPVRLSKEQSERVKTVSDEIGKAGFGAIENRLPGEIGAILTPRQLRRIAKYRATGDAEALSRELKLTNEQMKRVRAMIDDMAASPHVKDDWPTFGVMRSQLREYVDAILTADQTKNVEDSGSYSENFRRPTWGWELGGPTLSGSGMLVPGK